MKPIEISVLDLNAHYRCYPRIKHLKVSHEEEKARGLFRLGTCPATLAVMQQHLTAFRPCLA